MKHSPFPLFLDRDGTVIVDRHYLHDPADVVLEIEAAAGLRSLIEIGAIPVIVTNQSGVGRGMFTESSVHAVHDRLDHMLRAEGVKISGYYYCPHVPEDDCDCRKPSPGMAQWAAKDLSLKLDEAIVVGDKMSDLKLAQSIGAYGILVRTGKGTDHAAQAIAEGFDVVENLNAVRPLLMAKHNITCRNSH